MRPLVAILLIVAITGLVGYLANRRRRPSVTVVETVEDRESRP